MPRTMALFPLWRPYAHSSPQKHDNERKFMNDDTKPTTSTPTPTAPVETKPGDQTPTTPTTVQK